MANITTRDTLRVAVRTWQEWGSDLTDDLINAAIALTEDTMNGDLMQPEQSGQPGGVNQMLVTTTGTFTSGDRQVPLPADFLGVNSFRYTGASGDEAVPGYLTPQQLYLQQGGAATSAPISYSVIADNIELGPAPDTGYAYTLLYYASIPALTDLNQSNWVIARFPNAYLFGTLAQVSILLMDDDRAVKMFVPSYARAVDRIKMTSRRLQYPSGSLQIALDTATP